MDYYEFPVRVKKNNGMTLVEISCNHKKPDGIARNALIEKFSVQEEDADWILLDEDEKEVKRYLETLGIEFE
jgi:hypothetical protein